MKRILLIMMSVCFSMSMSAQTLMQVKQEGGYTNIRSGRGTNYSIVTKYKDGSSIYVGSNQGGWRPVYQSASGGFIGYISSSKVVRYGSSNRSYGGGNYYDLMGRAQSYLGGDALVGRIKPEGGYTNIRATSEGGRVVSKIKDGTVIFYIDNCDIPPSHLPVYNTNGRFLGYVHSSKISNY